MFGSAVICSHLFLFRAVRFHPCTARTWVFSFTIYIYTKYIYIYLARIYAYMYTCIYAYRVLLSLLLLCGLLCFLSLLLQLLLFVSLCRVEIFVASSLNLIPVYFHSLRSNTIHLLLCSTVAFTVSIHLRACAVHSGMRGAQAGCCGETPLYVAICMSSLNLADFVIVILTVARDAREHSRNKHV